MNILGPRAKASHGLALLCWVFDQPSFNLLSWVWFWFCTLSSGPPLCWLFFEVSGRLVGRRAHRKQTCNCQTGCNCFYILHFVLNCSTSLRSHTWALQMFPYLWVCGFWVNKCGLKTKLFTSISRYKNEYSKGKKKECCWPGVCRVKERVYHVF